MKKITSPFQHKCPSCDSGLYMHHKDKLFLNALTLKAFECNGCDAKITWNNNNSLKIAKYCFITSVLVGALFPILSILYGITSLICILIITLGAISSILAWVGVLTMSVTRLKSSQE